MKGKLELTRVGKNIEVNLNNKPWTYCLIKDTNVKVGNACKFILGLVESVEEV